MANSFWDAQEVLKIAFLIEHCMINVEYYSSFLEKSDEDCRLEEGSFSQSSVIFTGQFVRTWPLI